MAPLALRLLKNEGGIFRFQVAGKVSRDGWTEPGEPLARMFGEGVYTQPCMLSLSEAVYIDSTGVEWLLTLHRSFKERGGVLVLHSPTTSSKQLLKLMRMDLVLNIVDDENAGLALITQKEVQRVQQGS